MCVCVCVCVCFCMYLAYIFTVLVTKTGLFVRSCKLF